MVRCFIGFLLPENVRKEILSIQEEMKKWPITCKFVETENLHVCLSFLGDVNEQEVERIKKELDSIGKNYSKFEASIGRIKPIPSENYIRVLVLDVLDEGGILEKIRKDVVQRIGGDSKPPHLTLCRVKNVSDKKNVAGNLEEMRSDLEKFSFSSIQLIKSELSRNGPVYSVIHESELL